MLLRQVVAALIAKAGTSPDMIDVIVASEDASFDIVGFTLRDNILTINVAPPDVACPWPAECKDEE